MQFEKIQFGNIWAIYLYMRGNAPEGGLCGERQEICFKPSLVSGETVQLSKEGWW